MLALRLDIQNKLLVVAYLICKTWWYNTNNKKAYSFISYYCFIFLRQKKQFTTGNALIYEPKLGSQNTFLKVFWRFYSYKSQLVYIKMCQDICVGYIYYFSTTILKI